MLLLLALVAAHCVIVGQAAEPIPAICGLMSPCGADCYTTCDNQCQCDVTASGEIPFAMYGGECQETGFCESEFLHMENCVEEGGPSCPTMVGLGEAVADFTQYDYRIDVRSVAEWDEGHANNSIPAPGLAFNPAAGYMDKLSGLEDKSILVYCRSGGRAFDASINLMKWGFNKITSFYQGGFPNLNAEISRNSQQSDDHPSNAFCYITGKSDICPAPLPTSQITSVETIASLGKRIVLVDVRSTASGRLPNAVVLRTDKKVRVRRFLKKLRPKRDVIVTFCNGGNSAFRGAKKILEAKWEGEIYWVDNGGYNFLRELDGIESL